MIECIERIRNKNGAIIRYKLLDTDRHTTVDVSADELRKRMANGLNVHNLKLSKTYAILMIDTAKLEDTKIEYCIQVKENMNIYGEMVADENREITAGELDALRRIGGFYAIIDNGVDSVQNIRSILKEAMIKDLNSLSVDFKGRTTTSVKAVQKVNLEEAKLERAIDKTLSEYKYIVKAELNVGSRFARHYRLLFNEKLK